MAALGAKDTVTTAQRRVEAAFKLIESRRVRLDIMQDYMHIINCNALAFLLMHLLFLLPSLIAVS